MVPAPMAHIPGFTMDLLYATSESPPPSRPPGLADLVDVNLPPGHIRWMVIDHAPPGTYGAPNRTAELSPHRNLEARLGPTTEAHVSPSER